MTDKMTERLDVRISHQKKQDFTEACDMQSDTPSNAIRRFVNSYIRRAKRDETREGLRAFLPRHLGKFAASISLCLIAAITIRSLFSNTDALFTFYDFDKNGVIELGEIAPNDIHLHRVLNIDGEAGISPDEFVAKATMVWKFTDPKTMPFVETKNFGFFKITKSISSSSIDDLPEGTYLFPKNPKDNLISIEAYKAENMTPEDLRGLNYQELRSRGPMKTRNKVDKYTEKFVVFDLTNFERPQINVSEQISTALYSRSKIFSRSVFWVEGVNTPHFVMGRGADAAILTNQTSKTTKH